MTVFHNAQLANHVQVGVAKGSKLHLKPWMFSESYTEL